MNKPVQKTVQHREKLNIGTCTGIEYLNSVGSMFSNASLESYLALKISFVFKKHVSHPYDSLYPDRVHRYESLTRLGSRFL